MGLLGLRVWGFGSRALLLMVDILHYLEDPILWELWSIFLIMGNAGFLHIYIYTHRHIINCRVCGLGDQQRASSGRIYQGLGLRVVGFRVLGF